MQTSLNNSGNYNSFGFSLQTSSGDTINLSMYDSRVAQISHESTDQSQTTTYSLSHAYGYKFEYKGNGIDENDQKEIDAAMKVIQPMMDEYFKNVQESANTTTLASLTNTSYSMNALLPKTNDANTQNYINDALLKSIDAQMAKPNNRTEKMLQEAHKLFQSLLGQQVGFDLYM